MIKYVSILLGWKLVEAVDLKFLKIFIKFVDNCLNFCYNKRGDKIVAFRN